MNRFLLTAVGAFLLLAACAPAEAPPTAPDPEASTEPRVPSEIALEERIRAPFAVQTVGRIGPPARAAAVEPAEPAAVAWEDAVVEPAPMTEETPTADAAPVAPDRPRDGEGYIEHPVAAGESFWSISRRYGVALDVLADANLHIDPGNLQVGDLVRVPGGAPPADPSPTPADTRGDAPRTYEVRAGDTLWGISRRFGVSMDAIRRANDIQGDAVRLGQTLIIPDPE